MGQSTLRRFSANVTIDGMNFTLSFDISPNHFIGHHDLLIGGKLLNLAEICIGRRKTSLAKFTNFTTKEQDTNWAEIMCINVQHNVEVKDDILLQHV